MIGVTHVSTSLAGPSGSADKIQSVETEGMPSLDLPFGMVFFLQTIVGILGNISLMVHYIFLYFTKCRLPPTDLILKHMAIANSLAIICKGIPQIMARFGWNVVLDDIGCKVTVYVHRVGRGVSFGTTCLLSIFQAITISLRNSRWSELQVKAPKYTGFCIFLCWILHMLVNTVFPVAVISNWRNKTTSNVKSYGYCSSVRQSKTTEALLHLLLLSFPDVVCLGLMVWASGSVVFILYKHKQRVQYIQRNNVSSRTSPKTRATKTILVVVSTFVSFYILSSTFQVFIAVFYHPSLWMLLTDALISMCFPAVSPFIVMIYNSRVSRFCFSLTKKT